MEFIWAGNENLGDLLLSLICKCNNLNSMCFIDIIWHKGDLGKIFTGVLYNNYDPPPFLCLKKDQFDESVKLLT